MGMRFRKSIKLLPGVKINISGSGISTTVGVRGASMSLGRRGAYLNLGIPGTGLSYRQRVDVGSNSTQSTQPARRSSSNNALERMKVLRGLSFDIEPDGTVSLYNDYGAIDKKYLSYAWEVKGKKIEEHLCDIISSSEEERVSIENIY